MSLKIIQGGKQTKNHRCNFCSKIFESDQGHIDTFVWLTVGKSSGFQTDNFTICGHCTAHLLIELKAYIESRAGIKKK